MVQGVNNLGTLVDFNRAPFIRDHIDAIPLFALASDDRSDCVIQILDNVEVLIGCIDLTVSKRREEDIEFRNFPLVLLRSLFPLLLPIRLFRHSAPS